MKIDRLLTNIDRRLEGIDAYTQVFTDTPTIFELAEVYGPLIAVCIILMFMAGNILDDMLEISKGRKRNEES